ncbi:hypothetical protein Anas_11817 [Armadillidium nasatum]|uniref:DUF659 domain-containing protein n=1 Tax=Armadillidium nasatum TaxID=96803 RepID=A0A5N5T2C2_9CRUS|nr:hypothetical protein Anas_11817 [Armadillidium nasatum]
MDKVMITKLRNLCLTSYWWPRQSTRVDRKRTTTAKQREELDLQVAKFFFYCNIAFDIVESKYFIKLPPNRKRLTNQLLDKVNEEVIQAIKNDLTDSCLTLVQDGWTNVSNDPMIAHCLHNGHQSFLISSVHSESEDKKKAKYCTELAIEAITFIKKYL